MHAPASEPADDAGALTSRRSREPSPGPGPSSTHGSTPSTQDDDVLSSAVLDAPHRRTRRPPRTARASRSRCSPPSARTSSGSGPPGVLRDALADDPTGSTLRRLADKAPPAVPGAGEHPRRHHRPAPRPGSSELGLALAAHCDSARGADTCRFRMPEIGLGPAPAWGGAMGRPHHGRPDAARIRELMLTCDEFDALTAQHLGLLHKVAPLDQLDDAVTAWTRPSPGAPRRRSSSPNACSPATPKPPAPATPPCSTPTSSPRSSPSRAERHASCRPGWVHPDGTGLRCLRRIRLGVPANGPVRVPGPVGAGYTWVMPDNSERRSSAPVVFTGVRLVDWAPEAAPVESAAVVVEDGRFTYAGPEHARPRIRAATVVDCGGRTLLPGFFDCHLHFLMDSNARLHRPTADQPAHGHRLRNGPAVMRETLHAGITTASRSRWHRRRLPRRRDARLDRGTPAARRAAADEPHTGGHADFSMLQRPATPRPSSTRSANWPTIPARSLAGDTRRLLRDGATSSRSGATVGVNSSERPAGGRGPDRGGDRDGIVDETQRHRGRPVAAHAQGTVGIKNALRGG
ncbi:hypothetical protein ACRAWF_07555 [Streptomyces sp. L7]